MLAALVLTLSAAWLTLISGLLIPLLTGAATKLGASNTLKGFVTLVLSVAAGVLQSVVADGGVITDQTLLNAALTFGVATLMFFNLYGPAKVDAKLWPSFGLGGNTPADGGA